MRKQQVCLMLLAICAGSINLAWGMDKKETECELKKVFFTTINDTCPGCRCRSTITTKCLPLICCGYILCKTCHLEYLKKQKGCLFHKSHIEIDDGDDDEKCFLFYTEKLKRRCSMVEDHFEKLSEKVKKYFLENLAGKGKAYTRRKLIMQNYLKHVKDISNTQRENKKDMYVNWYEGLEKYINEELIKK